MIIKNLYKKKFSKIFDLRNQYIKFGSKIEK